MENDEIEAQLHEVRDALTCVIARAKAFEYATRALIIASPDAERLCKVWTGLLPSIVDIHDQGDVSREAVFQEHLHAALGLISQQIEQIPRQR